MNRTEPASQGQHDDPSGDREGTTPSIDPIILGWDVGIEDAKEFYLIDDEVIEDLNDEGMSPTDFEEDPQS